MITNIIVLLYVSAVWGSAFVFIKIGEETIAPITEQAGRALIGFLTLLIVSVVLKKDIAGHAKHWFAYIVFAILGLTLLFLGVGLGEQYVSAGLTAVMVSIAPLVTYIIMVFILREERFTMAGVAGLVMGVAGLVLVIGVDKILSGGSALIGVLLIGGGFAFFAVNGVVQPKLASGADPIVSSTYFMGMAAVILSVLAFIFESPLSTPITRENMAAELILGVICTASGFAGYYYILSKAGAFFSSMTFYFVPVFGVLAGVLMLGENLTVTRVIGIGVVFAGVYLINRERLGKGRG